MNEVGARPTVWWQCWSLHLPSASLVSDDSDIGHLFWWRVLKLGGVCSDEGLNYFMTIRINDNGCDGGKYRG